MAIFIRYNFFLLISPLWKIGDYLKFKFVNFEKRLVVSVNKIHFMLRNLLWFELEQTILMRLPEFKITRNTWSTKDPYSKSVLAM